MFYLFASLISQVLSLLRDSSVRGPVYRATVAVAEGMQARRSDVSSELVAKPLLEPLLKCLDSTGWVLKYSIFVRHIWIHYNPYSSILKPMDAIQSRNWLPKMAPWDQCCGVFKYYMYLNTKSAQKNYLVIVFKYSI